MKARAAQKSSNQWVWCLGSLFHHRSLISRINVFLLQVQSKHSQNANFVLRVSVFAVPITAHKMSEAWFYFHVGKPSETGALERKVCWGAAPHKSCSEANGMQNQLTQQLNLGKH